MGNNFIIFRPMTELEYLRQEVERLERERHQDRSRLEQQTVLLGEKLEQQSVLLDEKDALLEEQSKTIRNQEAKLEAQQLEINRLLQQAFGRRSEPPAAGCTSCRSESGVVASQGLQRLCRNERIWKARSS